MLILNHATSQKNLSETDTLNSIRNTMIFFPQYLMSVFPLQGSHKAIISWCQRNSVTGN